AVEQNGVAILHTCRRRLSDQAFLLQLLARPLLKRRQRRPFAREDRSAMGSAKRSLLVPVIQVTADRRFRNLNLFGQISQNREALLAYQVQHPLTPFLDEHATTPANLEDWGNSTRIIRIIDRYLPSIQAYYSRIYHILACWPAKPRALTTRE